MSVLLKKCKACGNENFEQLFNATDYWVSKESFAIRKCGNCGFAYTFQAPSEAEIGKYYQHADYVSHSDTSQGLFFKVYHLVREYMLGRKRAIIENHVSKGRVLDIGAGTGYFLNHMQQKGWQVDGVEPDAGAGHVAAKNFKIALRQKLDDFSNLENFYQSISMWHVLEHVHEPEKYFQIFSKILATDGRVFIAVPNHSSADAKFYAENWAAWDVPKHLWHFTPNAMKLFAEQNGFEIEKKYMLPFDSFYISMLSEKIAGNALLSYLRGPWIGLYSFIKSLINTDCASSVVYVLKIKS
jgi:2-polyprenyl-3-methyl-5-hydroxy-6-metoxy-1,4-benzoquinol methylase